MDRRLGVGGCGCSSVDSSIVGNIGYASDEDEFRGGHPSKS